jgi:hypothetical protein
MIRKLSKRASTRKVDEWQQYKSRIEARKQRAASSNIVLRPLLEGYLFKQGSVRKNWKKRWFVIDYPNESITSATEAGATGAAATGSSSSSSSSSSSVATVTTATNNNNNNANVRRRLLYFTSQGGDLKGEFILDNTIIRIDDDSDRAYSFSLVSSQKTLYLQASSEEERHYWACELDRNYWLQSERKKIAVAVKVLVDGHWFLSATSSSQKLFLTLNASKDALTCRTETSSVPEVTIPLDDLKNAVVTEGTAANTDTETEKGVVDNLLELTFCHESKSLMRETTAGSFRSKKKQPLNLHFQKEGDLKDDLKDVNDINDSITERKSDGKRMWRFKSKDIEMLHLYHLALNDIIAMIEREKDYGRKSVTFDDNNTGGEVTENLTVITGATETSEGITPQADAKYMGTTKRNANVSKPLTPSPTKKARGKSAKSAQSDFIGPCLSHAISQYLAEEEKENNSKTEITNSDNTNDIFKIDILPPLTSEDFQAKTRLTSSLEIRRVDSINEKTTGLDSSKSETNKSDTNKTETNETTTTEPTTTEPTTTKTKEYDFRAYAPKVFHCLRQLAGITNNDFSKSMSSLSGGAVGEGKSGMVFFRSKDGRFIIKTLKESEKNFFYHKGVLEAYYKYMKSHTNTLLCSFYGLFKIRFNHKKNDWIVVIVMENAFNTKLKLHSKFDLKGSTKNRFVTEKEQAEGCSVLKDLNFQSKIYLNKEDAIQFIAQAEEDAAFLASHNMMDYSLLLGVHTPDLMESDEEEEDDDEMFQTVQESGSKLRKTKKRDRWRRHHGGIEGRSPVPTSMNEVYFLSIIDFLQLYDTSKKLENAIKGKIMGREREVSAVSGIKYAERFTNYVKTVTEGVVGVMSEEEKVNLAREEFRKREEEKSARGVRRRQNVEAKNQKIQQEKIRRLSEEEQIARAERQALFLSKIRVSDLFESLYSIFINLLNSFFFLEWHSHYKTSKKG